MITSKKQLCKRKKQKKRQMCTRNENMQQPRKSWDNAHNTYHKSPIRNRSKTQSLKKFQNYLRTAVRWWRGLSVSNVRKTIKEKNIPNSACIMDENQVQNFQQPQSTWITSIIASWTNIQWYISLRNIKRFTTFSKQFLRGHLFRE